ncbi:efflux RND transporter periplasmic adaptor subunit [Pseudoduganella sp. SL102]|uniref:Efflux RND transporter periplasmic adaptor subunit n=1 Tax=Pseudoduganella albidiflava TaxID=321983 RepID=A0A411X0N4_9BURK|nr:MULTISPECIES: efflux RND transporter periplasmic adaptor subunit [Pseudoduganella]QBI02526.1 efflux RND transporter periplasmic adaptor subunit [Pseudoduganella albidiflava]WBS05000.1 efflux RND transporter periplasmic adaptor subunit [Pseudoduganella sp. SL102]GGY42082.1 MexE family multidrug efflux RND transporter periplasmic adaptor subunit [Pseudoduganella albidiflava]
MTEPLRLRFHRPQCAAAALVLTLSIPLLLIGCDRAGGQPAAAAAPPPSPVSAAVVVERDIVETQEFSGRLEAVERVEIRPRVPGYITAVQFTPGTMVKKGQALFTIDARPYQAELGRAEANASSARARAELAKVELARAERLLADRAIAAREFDERAASQKDLEAAARSARAEVETARLNVAYTRVTAPIDGRVSKAEITVGNLVDQSAVLTSVVSTDRIYASFDGDEDTYLRVRSRTGQGRQAPVAVRIGLANETGFPHEGKLEFVDNRLDPATGSVRMRATFANEDGTLVPGLFARVQIAGGNHGEGGGAARALLIHDRAVNTDQDRKFVYVVKNGKAEYRPVVLGPAADGLRVVRKGLAPGEQIVVGGLQRVRPGAPVQAKLVPMDTDPDAPARAGSDTAAQAKAS